MSISHDTTTFDDLLQDVRTLLYSMTWSVASPVNISDVLHNDWMQEHLQKMRACATTEAELAQTEHCEKMLQDYDHIMKQMAEHYQQYKEWSMNDDAHSFLFYFEWCKDHPSPIETYLQDPQTRQDVKELLGVCG